MLGANETWVTILLQQKRVDMFRSNVKSETRRCLQAQLNLFHRFAINVDFAGRTGLQKLSTLFRDER